VAEADEFDPGAEVVGLLQAMHVAAEGRRMAAQQTAALAGADERLLQVLPGKVGHDRHAVYRLGGG